MIKLLGGNSSFNAIKFSSKNYEVTSNNIGKNERNISIGKVRNIQKILKSIPATIIFYILEILLFIKFPKLTFVIYTITAIFYLISIFFVIHYVKLRKNHSAEHMVFNGYRKLKKVPTLEEAKEMSRFSISCGSNLVCTYLIVYLFSLFIPIPVDVVSSIIFMLRISSIFTPMQVFFTANPDDDNILTAISALYELIKVEEIGCGTNNATYIYITDPPKSVLKKIFYKYEVEPGCTIGDIETALDNYFSINNNFNITIRFNSIDIEVNRENYTNYRNMYLKELDKIILIMKSIISNSYMEDNIFNDQSLNMLYELSNNLIEDNKTSGIIFVITSLYVKSNLGIY